MKDLKNFCKKYNHGIPAVIYFTIYMIWFRHLEKTRLSDLAL